MLLAPVLSPLAPVLRTSARVITVYAGLSQGDLQAMLDNMSPPIDAAHPATMVFPAGTFSYGLVLPQDGLLVTGAGSEDTIWLGYGITAVVGADIHLVAHNICYDGSGGSGGWFELKGGNLTIEGIDLEVDGGLTLYPSLDPGTNMGTVNIGAGVTINGGILLRGVAISGRGYNVVMHDGAIVNGDVDLVGGPGDGGNPSGNGGSLTLQSSSILTGNVDLQTGPDGGGVAGTLTVNTSTITGTLSPDAATVHNATINGVLYPSTYP